MGQREQGAQQRNFGLDLVRALAIVLVLLAHGTALVAGVLPDTSRFILLYIGGYFGVELFFALSGCLIVGGLLRQLDTRPVLDGRAVVTFWQRRWWRTLPNYAVFLCLNATLFAAWFQTPLPDARYLIFAQNLAWPHPPAMGEAWSLAVEEWFYLLLPVLLLLSLKLLPQPRKAVPILLMLWVMVGALARLAVAHFIEPEWDAGLRKIALLRLDAIAWGGLAACWMHYRPAQAARMACSSYWLGLLGLLVSTVWLSIGVVNLFQPLMAYVWLFTLTGASIALCLPKAVYWRPAPRRYMLLVTGLSRISDSLYRVHVSVALPVMQLPSIVAHTSLPWRLIGYLGISLAAAYAAYRLVEKPTLALRERTLSPASTRPE
nr:acyltransferase [Halomonas sp.]